MRKASLEPLKGAVSALKALQGSETETRELLGGTKEKRVSGQTYWIGLGQRLRSTDWRKSCWLHSGSLDGRRNEF